MSAAMVERVLPEAANTQIADEAASQIERYFERHPDKDVITLVVGDDPEPEHLELPRPAVELFLRILSHMAKGRGVTVVPFEAELTTQQAADMLNVSRPYLIGLLERGEIEYKKVGSHRRVRAESLFEYKQRDDRKRRETADRLSALSQDLGV